jgi:hypothetical protein
LAKASMNEMFPKPPLHQVPAAGGSPVAPGDSATLPVAETDACGTGQSGGFVARLGGISLLDLVQFECLRGGQRILRVSSRGQSGYLYFRDGSLVHAATAIASGTAAVREMLSWQSGSVESGMGGWPTRESITAPWQEVLVEAAGGKVKGQPAPLSSAWVETQEALRQAQPTGDPAAAVTRTGTPVIQRGSGSSTQTVVLTPTGELIEGGNVHGLPEAASYAAHMAELIGGFLGFDRFCALEVSYGNEQLLVGRGKSGNLLARREKDPAALEDLRREVSS